MLEVLKHHIEYIKENCNDFSNIDEARYISRKILLPKLRTSKLLDGTVAYPNLDDNRMVDNLATVIVAINTRNYIEVTEKDDKGWLNKDIICEACGNLEKVEDSENKYMCGSYKKEMIIVNKILNRQNKSRRKKIMRTNLIFKIK